MIVYCTLFFEHAFSLASGRNMTAYLLIANTPRIDELEFKMVFIKINESKTRLCLNFVTT